MEEKFEDKVKWEVLTVGNNFSTQRLPVHGGWIVRSVMATSGALSMCFVPDPDHEWLEPCEIDIDNIYPVIADKTIEEEPDSDNE